MGYLGYMGYLGSWAYMGCTGLNEAHHGIWAIWAPGLDRPIWAQEAYMGPYGLVGPWIPLNDPFWSHFGVILGSFWGQNPDIQATLE